MQEVRSLAETTGVQMACDVLGVPRASWYRAQRATIISPATARPRPERALNLKQQQAVLDVLHSEKFVDMAPHEVYASLLDEGRYLCSIRTMYRLLEQADEVRERRNQRRHRVYQRPELLAEEPNQLWSWDITWLKGPSRGLFFYLYAMIDVFSRYIVGWLLADEETGELGKRLIEVSYQRQAIQSGQLIIHNDNGSQMKAKPVTTLITNLGLQQSFSRPSISDDNPYSEAHFKTLKYRPGFPERFGSLLDAKVFCRQFFTWYNEQHYHTGIALLTPHAVHTGTWQEVVDRRQGVLDAAYDANPERFVKKRPVAARPPAQVWINRPFGSGDPPTTETGGEEVLH